MISALKASEVGVAAADTVLNIAARELAGAPIASYVESDTVPWSVLADGGWDTIGIREDAGGATLVDLAVTARAWGTTCIPLPFVVSMMAKRWSPRARATSAPVSLATPRRGKTGAGRAPFGGEPGVQVARVLDEGVGSHDEFRMLAGPLVDEFAPSLRLAETGWVTSLGREARLELGVVWAAEATGCAEQALALSADYAKNREQFGRPIGSFQAVKHRLADMHVKSEAAETAVLWAATEPGQGVPAARYALDIAARVVESAIQVHGGMGFTWEVGLHFYLRHIVVLRELVTELWE